VNEQNFKEEHISYIGVMSAKKKNKREKESMKRVG